MLNVFQENESAGESERWRKTKQKGGEIAETLVVKDCWRKLKDESVLE